MARKEKSSETAQDGVETSVDDLVRANQEYAEANERLTRELDAIRSSRFMRSGSYDTSDFQVGQDGVRQFEGDDLVKVETRTLDDPVMKQKIEMEAFSQEPVKIEVHKLSDENAPIAFEVSVNGVKEIFTQGETKVVKRMFVETLARAKKTGYDNVLITDQHSREPKYIYPSRTGLRYPFSVIEDKNPKGRAWLEAVLRQP